MHMNDGIGHFDRSLLVKQFGISKTILLLALFHRFIGFWWNILVFQEHNIFCDCFTDLFDVTHITHEW